MSLRDFLFMQGFLNIYLLEVVGQNFVEKPLPRKNKRIFGLSDVRWRTVRMFGYVHLK